MGEKKEKKDEKSEEETEFEVERTLQQVEVGDFVKVKQILDEAVVKAILDIGYKENHYWDNVKLLLMVVACLFAMVAQFYPMPFPDSRPLLGVCCAAYFTASSILQLIVTYIEKDCIMTTAPVLTESGAPTPDLAAGLVNSNQEPVENKTRAGGAVGLRIRTNFPRFSYDFTVAVQLSGPQSLLQKEPTGPPPNITSMRFKIHDYLTEEGFFDDERFEQHVASVVKDFEAGNYYQDKPYAGSKKEK